MLQFSFWSHKKYNNYYNVFKITEITINLNVITFVNYKYKLALYFTEQSLVRYTTRRAIRWHEIVIYFGSFCYWVPSRSSYGSVRWQLKTQCLLRNTLNIENKTTLQVLWSKIQITSWISCLSYQFMSIPSLNLIEKGF